MRTSSGLTARQWPGSTAYPSSIAFDSSLIFANTRQREELLGIKLVDLNNFRNFGGSRGAPRLLDKEERISLRKIFKSLSVRAS